MRERGERGGREGRDDCYTYYSDGSKIYIYNNDVTYYVIVVVVVVVLYSSNKSTKTQANQKSTFDWVYAAQKWYVLRPT